MRLRSPSMAASISISQARLPLRIFPPPLACFRRRWAAAGPTFMSRRSRSRRVAAATLGYVTYLGGNGMDVPVGHQVGRPRRSIRSGNDFFDQLPNDSDERLSNGARTRKRGHHARIRYGVAVRRDEVALLILSFGQQYGCGQRHDPRRGRKRICDRDDDVDGHGQPQHRHPVPGEHLPEGLAFQTISNAGMQFFVTKVSTNAPGVGSIAYSTYFGGATSDTNPPVAVGGGIAVDTNGNVYFSGTTNFLYTGCSSCSTHRLSDPECLPGLSGSGSSDKPRQSSDLHYLRQAQPIPMLLWRNSIPMERRARS